MLRLCELEECDRKHYGHGWCRIHYRRWLKHGTPYGARAVLVSDRFWTKVTKTNYCWWWSGGISHPGGYGSFNVGDGRWEKAHRFAYIEKHGTPPRGSHLDHICRNTLCVNPDHLRVTTAKENGEHRGGLNLNNKSGYRGVSWDARKNKWQASVKHHRKRYFFGYFESVEDANQAAIYGRNQLFTHNDKDR